MSYSPSFVALQSQSHREQLVASLQARGWLHAPALAQAFLQMPHEIFVPAVYQREAVPGMVWTRRTAEDMEGEQWLSLIYQDEPLITKLDERHWPVSSSSAPSVMARMLEALEVQPEQKVLEIGTGRGYNAALIAHLTGDPARVTTIEVDPIMAERAERLLHTIVGAVAVQAGDGRWGAAACAPFDRVIATASAGYLPRPWYEQLAPGGRLVMDLQGTVSSSGFLVVEKSADGTTARGTFWHPPLCFMPLIDPQAPAEAARSLFQQPCAEEIVVEPASPFPAIFQDPAFRWFFQ